MSKKDETTEPEESSKIPRPVKCLECEEAGKTFRQHILIPHIVTKHKMEVVEYLDKHRGERSLYDAFHEMIASKLGMEKLQSVAQSGVTQIARKRVEVPFTDLFPQFADAKSGTEYDGTYPIFKKADNPPGSRRVYEDKHYWFPERETVTILKVMVKKRRGRIWIKGFSGTGKTELIRQIAFKIRAPLYEINGNSSLQRSTLVGTWGASQDKGTYFKYGKLSLWFKYGGILAIHEYDTMSPHTVNIFKSVLEDPATLSIEETGETLEAHPDSYIIVTANTWGKGDDTGLFVANTFPQSAADRRRWSARIKLDYLPPAEEIKLLGKYFEPKSSEAEKLLENVVDFANRVREGFKNRTIDYTISPAELINWIENAGVLDSSIHYAAKISFLNDLEPDVYTAVSAMLEAVFGPDPEAAATP